MHACVAHALQSAVLLSYGYTCNMWTSFNSSGNTLSQKVHAFCDIFPRLSPIFLILAGTYPQEIENKQKCTAHYISFHMFVMYLINYGNNFYDIYDKPVASNTMFPHKHQIVTLSNVYVIRASVLSHVHQFLHRRVAVYATWSIASLITCWCRLDEMMRSCSDQMPLKFAFWQKIYINLY